MDGFDPALHCAGSLTVRRCDGAVCSPLLQLPQLFGLSGPGRSVSRLAGDPARGLGLGPHLPPLAGRVQALGVVAQRLVMGLGGLLDGETTDLQDLADLAGKAGLAVDHLVHHRG